MRGKWQVRYGGKVRNVRGKLSGKCEGERVGHEGKMMGTMRGGKSWKCEEKKGRKIGKCEGETGKREAKMVRNVRKGWWKISRENYEGKGW